MDTFRGLTGEGPDPVDYALDADLGDDQRATEPPPSPVGQDERRMQVRAYNHWASLLGERNFPSIEDLDPEALPDFGPFSVLLDFTAGIEDPAVQYLGDQLADECGAEGEISTLADVPSRSLLSRITDHYMQILANQAPIGFEAEFVNQRGQTILYRGILLPFSSDDDTIDFIYGVINWKALADQRTTDELMLEIDQALDVPAEPAARRDEDEHTVWADGPAATGDDEAGDDDVFDLAGMGLAEDDKAVDFPVPAFGADPYAGADDALELAASAAELDPLEMHLADWLASARELAQAARSSEDRTRTALYAAIGRAYDFSLAAAHAPDDFSEIVADAGLTVQDRAPMTPVVKLVFGADYDKTRLTEYAAALEQGHRLGVARGAFGDYLSSAPGGLKGVVAEERRWRKQASGKAVEPREAPREALARKLRQLAPAQLAAEGPEFALVVARRLASGEIVLIGEVPDDVALLERAAKKLLG